MKILKDWGFTLEGLGNNQRGEYLLFIQVFLLIGFVFLPVISFPGFHLNSPWIYVQWGGGILLVLGGLILIIQGLLNLGNNLTPLPYPKDDGELVTTGIYQWVRHPLYSGIVFMLLGVALILNSLSHLLATFVLLMLLNIKANYEENWLKEKYPHYQEYQQRVKKLIPGIF